MKSVTAHSSKPGHQFQLLEQIFLDACDDPDKWVFVPKAGSGDMFYSCRQNIETGDTITCQGNAD